MSAKAAEAEGGKKKGKMPVMLVLALVIGGGGFFMMKGKDKKKEPDVKLGEVAPFPKEFLVNLTDGGYLKTEIALQFKEGFDVKAKFEKNAAVIQNAFVLKLSSVSLADVRTFEQKVALKKELCKAANEALNEGEEDTGGKKKKHKKSSDDSEPENPSWDSDEGPVLRVLFTSFATQ